MTADGKGGGVKVTLPETGAFAVNVFLESTGGPQPLPALTVVADAPPLIAPPDLPDMVVSGTSAAWPGGRSDTPFHELLDVAQTRQVPLDDRLPLHLTVMDDFGVERLWLEYRVNHGPVCREELQVASGSTATHRHARHLFQLAGKVKDGDVLAFRLAAADNRRVAGLAPQTAFWPPPDGTQARWLLLRVRKAAPALARQEVAAQHDDIRDRVTAIQKALQTERTDLAQVREQPLSGAEQDRQLAALRRQNDAITAQLAQLADLAAARPGLRDLAERARQLTAGPLHRSEQALADAGRPEVDAARRAQLLLAADEELARAQQLLDGLHQDNDRAAQDRLDQLELAKLAERQAELARLAKDPAAQQKLEALRAEQAKLAAAMRRLAEKSSLVRAALDAARARQAQQLATQAQELTQKQQQLTMDGDKTFKHLVETKLAELMRQQQELAEKAAQLARDVKTEKTPEVGAARKAAEALKEGNAAVAVERQGQAVKELERLADSAAVQAQQEQARQLAEAQRELQEAVRRLTKLPDAEPEKTAGKQADVAAETAGLMKKLEQLGKDSQGTPTAGLAADEAAAATGEAATAMKLAQAQAKEGNLGKAQAEREQALKLLGKAAAQAQEAAQQLTQMARDPGKADQAVAGQALQQGRGRWPGRRASWRRARCRGRRRPCRTRPRRCGVPRTRPPSSWRRPGRRRPTHSRTSWGPRRADCRAWSASARSIANTPASRGVNCPGNCGHGCCKTSAPATAPTTRS